MGCDRGPRSHTLGKRPIIQLAGQECSETSLAMSAKSGVLSPGVYPCPQLGSLSPLVLNLGPLNTLGKRSATELQPQSPSHC